MSDPKKEKASLVKTVTLGGQGPISLAITTGRLIMAKKKDIDVADPDNGIMGRMFIDPVVLAENCWKLYSDRISAVGINTAEEFYELLDDKGNRDLDAAFKNAVRDFFTWGETFVRQVETLIEVTEEKVEEAFAEATETEAEAGTETESTSPSQEESGIASGSMQESSV